MHQYNKITATCYLVNTIELVDVVQEAIRDMVKENQNENLANLK